MRLQMEYRHHPLIRSQEAPDQFQKCRLAGTPATDNSKYLTGTNSQIDGAQCELMSLPLHNAIGSD